MKRLFIFALAVMLLIAGCGQAPAAGFTADDLQLTVNGNAYTCGTLIEPVLTALGDDYAYAEGKSCAYDGLDKTYIYPTVEFLTNPLADGDTVGEIYTENEAVTTSKGIAVGASRADVSAAYGVPVGNGAQIMIYRTSDQPTAPSLCFDLENEIVIAITLTTQPLL